MSEYISPRKVADDGFQSLAALREATLEAAGLDAQSLGTLLAKCLQKLNTLAEAQKITYFSYMGEVTDVKTDADGPLQFKATAEIARIVRDLAALSTRLESAPLPAVNNQVVVQIPWLDEIRQQPTQVVVQTGFDPTQNSDPTATSPHKQEPDEARESSE